MDRKDLGLVLVAVLAVSPLFYTFATQPEITGGGGGGTIPGWVFEQGGGVEACSYFIYQEGGTYYAKNQQPGTNRGKNQFSGTVSSTVIQNTVDSSSGPVCLGLGTFSLTARIRLKSNSGMIGMGFGTILQATSTLGSAANRAANSDQILDVPQGSNGVLIRDLMVDGAGFAVTGIRFEAGAQTLNSTISHVLVANTGTFAGILVSGRGIIVENSIVRGVQQITSGATAGIYVTSIFSDGIVIRNNFVFSTTNGRGILVEDQVKNVLIDGNYITSNGGNGIEVSGSAALPIFNITTTNNFSARNTGANGINYQYTRGGAISNNVVGSNDENGILVQQSLNILISSNVAKNNDIDNLAAGDGISIDGSSDILIVTNRAFDDQASKTQNAGVRLTSTVNNTLIAENDLRGNVGDGIVPAGTSNIYRINLGYVTENWGATSVANGGTISHGLAGMPDTVQCTTSITAEFCSITGLGATVFTVTITKHDGTAGTTQTIYWYAVFIP